MYEFVLQRNYNAEKRASDVKKSEDRRKQNLEGEANNMQLDKEDTRRSNLNGKWVFNILILLFIFIMFSKLTCKVQFHIAVWSLWVNAIRASSFIENIPQISAKPIAFQRNLLGKLLQNRPFFTNHFSAKPSSKIPVKSAIFSANLSLKIPRNLTFFPRPTRSPV